MIRFVQTIQAIWKHLQILCGHLHEVTPLWYHSFLGEI